MRTYAPHRIGLARVGVDMRIYSPPPTTGKRAPNGAGLDIDRKLARSARRYRATSTPSRRYQCSECDSYEHTAPRCPNTRRPG